MSVEILPQIATTIHTDLSLLVAWKGYGYEATIRTLRNTNAEIIVPNYEYQDECGCVEVGMLTAWVPIDNLECADCMCVDRYTCRACRDWAALQALLNPDAELPF